MKYARKQLQVFQVAEQYEALVREFMLSKTICHNLCFGQVSDYSKLEKFCDNIRKEMQKSDGIVFREKSSQSFTRPEERALAHDAILTYQQCNSRNKDLDMPITADELLFVCRRLKRNLQRCSQHKLYGEIYADRVYTALMMYSGGLFKINRCNKCSWTFAVKMDSNTQSNCTNCFAIKKMRKTQVAERSVKANNVSELKTG